jgi:hypothetical protein
MSNSKSNPCATKKEIGATSSDDANRWRTLLAMAEMKDLMSICVGQLFWHGASAHLRQRRASNKAPRSVKVVGLISSKFFSLLQPYNQSNANQSVQRGGMTTTSKSLATKPIRLIRESARERERERVLERE